MTSRTYGTPDARLGLAPATERVDEMTSRLPSKLFFRIGEVASLVGVEPHVLRYWEREFRSIRPTKSAKGQRVYSRKDVENLLRVRDLLYRDGFTIAGAKKRLQRAVATTGAPHDHAAHGVTETGSEPSAEEEDDRAESESEEEERDDEAALTHPASGPRAQARASVASVSPVASDSASEGPDPALRRKLNALRAEVESFLVDLESA